MRKPKNSRRVTESPRIEFKCNGIASPVLLQPSMETWTCDLPVNDPQSAHVVVDARRSVICMKNINGIVYMFRLNWRPNTGTYGMFLPRTQTGIPLTTIRGRGREKWSPFRLFSEDAEVYETSHNDNRISIKLTFVKL